MDSAIPATNSQGSAATENILDTRGMEPPRPILAILKRVAEGLESGSELRVKLDQNPLQLYDLLQQRGFDLAVLKMSDGTTEGRIRPRAAKNPHVNELP
jgi:TusA-related sulfurtransferase